MRFFQTGWEDENRRERERAKKVLTHRDLLPERSGVVSWSKLSLLVSKLKSADLISFFSSFDSPLSIGFLFFPFLVRFRASGRHRVNTSGAAFDFVRLNTGTTKFTANKNVARIEPTTSFFIRSNNKKERMNEPAPPPPTKSND